LVGDIFVVISGCGKCVLGYLHAFMVG